jgi:hypothetical protein
VGCGVVEGEQRKRERAGWRDTGGEGAEGVAARGTWQQEVARAAGTAVGCRAEKQSSARGGREREFPEDLFVILENCKDLLVKKNLTTAVELKQKCGQNESSTTFQALYLCFRV